MADRLAIYRSALMYLGNAAGLSSLTEVSPTRNALDAVWQSSVDYMLAKGLWNFGIRSVQLSQDEDIEALFGYQYAFSRPDDWIRTAAISSDPTYVAGFEDYEDQAEIWYANVDPLYIRYVSSDEAYGWNIGAWREPFAEALAAWLAFKSSLPLSSDKSNRNDLFALFKSLLKEAKVLDAVDERVQRRPAGRLVRARFSGRNER